MIPFFRKIRKKMADDNRPLKYMRYAIGEIVLVVIGILIALQINNWNEQRKMKKEKNTIIRSLMSDLVQDSAMIHSYDSILISKMDLLLEYYRRMHDQSANLDTVLRIAENEYSPDFNRIFNFNNSTLNSLESTGKFDLFDDKMRKNILDLRQQQLEYLKKSEINHELFLKFTSTYGQNYKFLRDEANSYVTNLVWRIDDERDFVLSFSNVISIHTYIINMTRGDNKIIMTETKNLMQSLQSKNDD